MNIENSEDKEGHSYRRSFTVMLKQGPGDLIVRGVQNQNKDIRRIMEESKYIVPWWSES